MALDKVIDSAILDAELLAVADAIRAKGGTSDVLAFPEGFVSAVGAISAGNGDSGGAAELLYETTFSLAESQTGTSEVSLATIETGLNLTAGTTTCVVITCTNDTDSDTSYNHFKARTQFPVLAQGGYVQAQAQSGIELSDKYVQYGAAFGLYIKSGTKNMASITIVAKGHVSWGFAPSGDYSVKIYQLSNKYFGLEEYMHD